jgi:hypothetical protein
MEEVLERIVDLYEALDPAEPGKGCADEVVEWRAKLSVTQRANKPIDRDTGQEDP